MNGEQQRLQALKELNLLDSLPKESFDRITRLASKLLDVPVTAISLTDENRQWFLSQLGMGGSEVPRDEAPCAVVTRTGKPLVIEDLSSDARYRGRMVSSSGLQFYAGAPLTTRDGHTLGALCVLDNNPRQFSSEQVRALQDLAAMTMDQIELQHAYGRIDPVSGLANRNQLADDLADLDRQYPGQQRTAVFVDLIESYQLSQAIRALGPGYVDGLVKTFTQAIAADLDPTTRLFHVGATQLLAIATLTDAHAIKTAIVERLDGLSDRITQHHNLPSSLTVGVFCFDLGQTKAEDVIRAGHNAAQDARIEGTQVGVYSPLSDLQHQRRYAVLESFPSSLSAKNEFSLVYQPRVDMHSGMCEAAEALVRWRHPELGRINPGDFIPLAEQTEHIHKLTNWVGQTAAANVKKWQKENVSVRISINASASNLEQADFGAAMERLLRGAGIDAGLFEVEFTESALMRNERQVIRTLHRLRELGVQCAIDDFGTGFSNFSYLRDLPVDYVKIDKSFISQTANPKSRALLRNMIAMVHDLGHKVVAEGVETQAAYDFLYACDCDEAQGYLLSHPLAENEFVNWVRRHNSKASQTDYYLQEVAV